MERPSKGARKRFCNIYVDTHTSKFAFEVQESVFVDLNDTGLSRLVSVQIPKLPREPRNSDPLINPTNTN